MVYLYRTVVLRGACQPRPTREKGVGLAETSRQKQRRMAGPESEPAIPIHH